MLSFFQRSTFSDSLYRPHLTFSYLVLTIWTYFMDSDIRGRLSHIFQQVGCTAKSESSFLSCKTVSGLENHSHLNIKHSGTLLLSYRVLPQPDSHLPFSWSPLFPELVTSYLLVHSSISRGTSFSETLKSITKKFYMNLETWEKHLRG